MFCVSWEVRGRPFNLKGRGGRGVKVFLFRSKIFFSDNTRVRIIIFCRAKREMFFQNLTLGYMTKILDQIIFFFLHQNQNIFFSNIGNQNIFLEKNHNPPLQVKWSFPKYRMETYFRWVQMCFCIFVRFINWNAHTKIVKVEGNNIEMRLYNFQND